MRPLALLLTVGALLLVSAAPAGAAHVVRIELHSQVDFSGRTGSVIGTSSAVRATGKVLVSARLDHGPWYVVMQTATDAAGRYRARFKPSHRGVYTVRLATPDRASIVYVIRVS